MLPRIGCEWLWYCYSRETEAQRLHNLSQVRQKGSPEPGQTGPLSDVVATLLLVSLRSGVTESPSCDDSPRQRKLLRNGGAVLLHPATYLGLCLSFERRTWCWGGGRKARLIKFQLHAGDHVVCLCTKSATDVPLIPPLLRSHMAPGRERGYSQSTQPGSGGISIQSPLGLPFRH